MKISVIGTGYVGLVVGTCFAETGNTVVCADIDTEKVAMLQAGGVPIYEPGLEELIRRNCSEDRLSFTTDVAQAVKDATVIFIAVGTPMDEDGSADLNYVLKVAETIGDNMDGYRVIVDKSTVPVGTSRKVAEMIKSRTNQPFDVVSNPEFLKEGTAIDDFMKPDRVVIGANDSRAAEIMKELYGPFVHTGKPILVMDPESAELTKYAANALLATRISFMNEIARLCDKVGANFSHVRKGVGTDARLGSAFLFAGVGYGGSCFPKDVRAIMRTSESNGYDFKIVQAVENVNAAQKSYLVEKIVGHYGEDLRGKRFAVWGLSFKPRTDDMREAPSLTIIPALLERGATIVANDPEAIEETRRVLGDRIEYAKKPMEAVDGADALLVITEWSEFRHPDLDELKQRLSAPVIFDGRNIFAADKMDEAGFTYFGIGTGTR
ncbi:MAG: UDP-glucose 6-dehydrogenase [Planctomycetes bacterium]|jgi:UDPglucose 6-dehydrogenase|nr:UDP-glucose 6-dehydrogenase [Planctomycetota bacterium]MDP6423780.1 UDP-glucose/GDP-mannose dehydrogenase family protein [Planctomycetota bacterium]MDP7340596.1 UDP-glucose/GDP-mannose dehydrogenase family protein [Vicinamibacterales bacterium]